MNNFNLEQILTFPFKEPEARKNFLIASLVYFLNFIIPILPLILIMGYTARIMRQIINGAAPGMPAWDDWESMFKDGLYLLGIRIVYLLPLFVILLPLFIGMSLMPIWLDSNGTSEQFAILIPIIFGLIMLIVFPLSLAIGLILPVAEAHTIAHNEFAAGFRFREWWPIFRANLGGFIAAFAIYYFASLILSIILQILVTTIILSCLLLRQRTLLRQLIDELESSSG